MAGLYEEEEENYTPMKIAIAGSHTKRKDHAAVKLTFLPELQLRMCL